MGKSNYSSANKHDPDEERHHQKTTKTFKCCCCNCTRARCIKICCVATLGPIVLLGAIIGIYLLVQRLSYVPPVTQTSTANDTLAFLNELTSTSSTFDISNSTYNNGSSSSNQTASVQTKAVAPVDPAMTFQTKVRPPWKDCGSNFATPRVVSMEVCELDDNRCSFKIELDWTLEIAFTMKSNISVIPAPMFQASGKAVYLGTPWRVQPFTYPDPCKDSNVECPLQPGKSYLYRNFGGIHQKDLPAPILFDTYADVRFKLIDPTTKKDILCVLVPAIVKV